MRLFFRKRESPLSRCIAPQGKVNLVIEVGIQSGEAGRARTDDDQIMSSEAMTGSSTVERGL